MQFLLALNDNRIASALVARGFGEDDLEEAFGILRRLVRKDLANVPKLTDKQASEQLTAIQNEAMATIGATLRHRAPEVHDHLLEHLPPYTLVSVGMLLDRLDKLSEPPPAGFGDVGVEALALLTRRGLTPEVRSKARELLDFAMGADASFEPSEDKTEEAVEHLIRYYGEWSQIGRSAVTDVNLQRKLGVRRDSKE